MRIPYEPVTFKVLFVHINCRYSVIFICGVIINTFIRIETTGVYGYLVLSVNLASSPRLLNRTEYMEKLPDASRLGVIRDRVHLDKGGPHKP